MQKFFSNIGWGIVEYVRRAATPFFLKMMFGMTMLACIMISNTELRTILIAVLFVLDCVLTFILLRSMGENAYKMKVVGQLKRENKPTGLSNGDGVYRPCKEYRPYKGAVIALIASVIPAILIIVGALTGSGGARATLMIAAGWAYQPVYAVYQISADAHSLAEGAAVAGASSLWWGFILLGVFVVISAVAYIMGGSKEKLRQYILARQTEDVQEGIKRKTAAQGSAESEAERRQNGKGAKKR